VNVLGWIVVGFVAGALARAATGRGGGAGCLGTIAIGVVGGVVGGVLFSWATGEGIGDFGFRSMLVAFAGAVLLLLVLGRAFERS